jgi:uncharacterized membrane protein YdbT with pleckstrin-like domain
MNYINRSLGAGERVVARAHFHWLYTLRAVLALIFLGVIILGIIIFFAMMIRKWTTEIGITNRRFILKTGLLTLNTQEIALANIEGVQVRQGFWGRVFGLGRLTIEGTGVDKIVTPTIADPVIFRREIESAKEGF